MSQEKYCKLVMVTGENNNKFYEMIYEGGSNFTVNYGRIESSTRTIQKSISEWDRLKRSKEKKGYKDVTALASVELKETTGTVVIKKLDDKIVNSFLVKMKEYTDGLVSETYSVEATSVSQAQVDEAQAIIDKLVDVDKKKHDVVNELLLELYTAIPRSMGQVKWYLMPHLDARFGDHVQKEQDNLDAMAGQVAQHAKDAAALEDVAEDTVIEKTMLDQLGVHMVEATNTKPIDYILKQLGRNKVAGIYSIKKETEDIKFCEYVATSKNKDTRFLIHGTRCSSVLPILETSLQIRPAGNFQFSGKAYGNGNYFSEVTQKSLGYTGYDNDQVLLIYEVHTGNPFVYAGWYTGNSFELSHKELSKRGYDSTHVSAGNGLLNSEIIAYSESQCRIRYAIWIKRK